MSTNYYFKSIKFQNFRGLKDISIDKLRRINIIGGYNGTGKSTLLEGLFLVLDRRGPLAVARPFQWRNVGVGGVDGASQLFHNLDKNSQIAISAAIPDGELRLNLSFGPAPEGITMTLNSLPGVDEKNIQNSRNNALGLHIEATINNLPDDASFSIPLPDGMAVNPYRVGQSKIPHGVMLTAKTRNEPQSDAVRFTKVVRDGKLKELLDFASVIRPKIRGLQLLQDGQSAVLHAENENNQLLPVSMLGDGLQSVVSIALAIMSSPGGVILLDEFDSTIHYSVLRDVWSYIGDLCNKYNCQVFAATHSRECIAAAVDGLGDPLKINDLKYIRLEVVDGKNEAINYSGKEIAESLEADWEIR